MLNKIRKLLLKHDLNLYENCKYVKPFWKVILLDNTEHIVSANYSYYSVDWILKDKIIDDCYIKINDSLLIPNSQIKEIKLISCDRFIAHTYSWLHNRNLCWYNTLEELQKEDSGYQAKLKRYQLL